MSGFTPVRALGRRCDADTTKPGVDAGYPRLALASTHIPAL
jgi:hypothetical protein